MCSGDIIALKIVVFVHFYVSSVISHLQYGGSTYYVIKFINVVLQQLF